MSTWIDRARPEIAEVAVVRLVARATSIYGQIGESLCRRHVDLALGALAADLQSGQFEQVRTAVQTIIEELAAIKQLKFADLRFFTQTLRSALRSSLASNSEPPELRQQVDDWLFELLMVCTMRFVTERDTALQEQAAELGVRRLESQLAELQAALSEKTELLEVIRQASTPIAPVVRGILVVPLVGIFDAVRAENLTEKLLTEVSRQHARAAILDISGVPLFDTTAAQLIIRLTRAVQLLGTEVILVGMSPENARTIVALGIDLAGLRTLGTLQDGLARALQLQRLRIAPAV